MKNSPIWLKDDGKIYDIKTMQRDMAAVNEFLNENGYKLQSSIQNANKVFYILNKDKISQNLSFYNVVNNDELELTALLCAFVANSNLSNIFIKDEKLKAKFDKIIASKAKYYKFISKPLENLNNPNLLKQIENVIANRQKILVEYRLNNSEILKELVCPYRIIFINENFYLACYSLKKEQFFLFRIGQILSIHKNQETFQLNYDLVDFIENHIQTPYSKYTKDFRKSLINIRIKVDSKKAKYFKMKKFFTSQIEETTEDDGDLIVRYTFTGLNEIEPFILSWLPFVEILEPNELKENIKNILQNYI